MESWNGWRIFAPIRERRPAVSSTGDAPAIAAFAAAAPVAVADPDSVHQLAILAEVLEHALLLLEQIAEQDVVLLFHHRPVREVMLPQPGRPRGEQAAGGKPDGIFLSFLCHVPGPLPEKFQYRSVAPLLARAIKAIHQSESVSALFDKA